MQNNTIGISHFPSRSLWFRLLQQLPSHTTTVSYWNIIQREYQHHTLHCPTWQTDCFLLLILLLLLLVLWSVFVFRQHTYWSSPKKIEYLDQNQYTICWPIQKAAGAEQTFAFIHYRGTREWIEGHVNVGVMQCLALDQCDTSKETDLKIK